MELSTLIFLGPSGSGKGTQVKQVKAYLEMHDKERPVVELVMGDLFRNFWQGEGYVEDLSRAINLSGGLQPGFLQINLWSNFLIDHVQGEEHIIIDGSPRRLVDLDAMEGAFEFFKRPRPTLIFVNIGPHESEKRLIGRAKKSEHPRPEDIDPALIAKRYEWFIESVMPVIEAMKARTSFRVLEIDGEQSIEKVTEDIFEGLGWKHTHHD